MLIVSNLFALAIDQELKEYVENHTMTHSAVGIFFLSFQKVSYFVGFVLFVDSTVIFPVGPHF